MPQKKHHRLSKIDARVASSILAAVLAIGAGLAGGACTSSPRPEPETPAATSAAPPASWVEKMQALSHTLSELLPLVASRTKFNDEKNQPRIEEGTKRLKTLAHDLKSASTPNADPSLRVMTGLFEEDIERALESLQSGNREYARSVLKDTTSYCIQCHTQSNNGPEFPRLNLNINTADLPLLERAEFFAATRQFDPAMETYTAVVADPSLPKTNPFEWEQAARSALAIVVRVKKDPAATQELLAAIGKNPSIPPSTQEAITAWKRSVNEWKKEKAATAKVAAKGIQKDPLNRAENMIKKAQARQAFPLDHSQDIAFFRASELLHDWLSEHGRNDANSGKALYLAGIAAEATRDMNFWTLHETYYEMCIRSAPHSKQAEQCYGRLKESLVLGYSGSGGVRIPPEVNRKLEELKSLSQTPPN